MALLISRKLFVVSQLMSVTISINDDGSYVIEGVPAESASSKEETLATLDDLNKVYEQYGIYKRNAVDTFMAPIKGFLGPLLNARRNRSAWKNTGVIDPVTFASVKKRAETITIVPGFVKPSGVWILPVDNAIVQKFLEVQVRAWPTFPGDPPIKLVDITLNISGGWVSVLQLETPTTSTSRLYSDFINMNDLQIPAGNYQMTFNVYDTQWNRNSPENHRNLAPHGERHINYKPN